MRLKLLKSNDTTIFGIQDQRARSVIVQAMLPFVSSWRSQLGSKTLTGDLEPRATVQRRGAREISVKSLPRGYTNGPRSKPRGAGMKKSACQETHICTCTCLLLPCRSGVGILDCIAFPFPFVQASPVPSTQTPMPQSGAGGASARGHEGEHGR